MLTTATVVKVDVLQLARAQAMQKQSVFKQVPLHQYIRKKLPFLYSKAHTLLKADCEQHFACAHSKNMAQDPSRDDPP